MSSRCLFILLIVASGMFGFGCKTGHSSKASVSRRSASKVVSSAKNVSTNTVAEAMPLQPVETLEEVEKRAEAMARFATGLSYDMNDRPEEAVEEYYKSALLRSDSQTFVVDTARRLLHDNQTQKAIDLLLKATGHTNANGTVHALLARAYLQSGATNQAIAASQTALKKLPDSLVAYQNLAEIYFQVGKPAEAIRLLEQAAKQPKADAVFLVGLVESYEKYLELQPKESDAIKKRALEVLQRAANSKPAIPALLQKMAEAFNKFGDPKKAAEIYRELIDKWYADLPLYRDRLRERLANVYLMANDKAHASEQLEAIVHDNPTGFPQAYYVLGQLAFEEKQYDKATNYFNKFIVVSPEAPEQAYYDLAGAQLNMEQAAEALKTLDRARERFPQNFVNEYYAALAWQRLKNYSEALKHYTTAEVIARATDAKRLDFAFYFQAGSCSERKQDYEQAEKYFQKALELKPEDPEALNYLGYMWTERGVNLEKARELIEKALKVEPKNAAYLDSFGWVLFKLNQSEQALSYMLKAVELSEKPDATIYDHLGDIYSALKQPEKARESWQKSLELEPSDQVKKKLGPSI